MKKRGKVKGVRCFACLSDLGFGFKRIANQTGFSKGTVGEYIRALGLSDPFLSEVRRDAANAAKKPVSTKKTTGWTPKEMARAWNLEWKGISYLGELKHWSCMPRTRQTDFPFDGVAWKRLNRAKVNAQARAWWRTEKGKALRKRGQRNPKNKIVRNLRSRLREYVKCSGTRILDLIGCSTTQLRAHIEFLFEPGMNWGNYGQWHVDHIKPCSSFDLTDTAQRCACFHWSNLQPLWASDNIAKSDSMIWKKAA